MVSCCLITFGPPQHKNKLAIDCRFATDHDLQSIDCKMNQLLALCNGALYFNFVLTLPANVLKYNKCTLYFSML